VGIGGAVRNLASASGHDLLAPYDLGVQGLVLSRKALAGLVETLAKLTPTERGDLPGIKPGRGDIILAAALTIEAVLELGGFAAIEATEAGLREGVFFDRELLGPHGEPLFDDVRQAAVRNLAIQYESDLVHVEHVAALSGQMFDSLADQGLIEPAEGERELLWAAAMLHDVGMTISYDDHHKHSRYLILNAGLPGFSPREKGLIGQMARYHRKGSPGLGEFAPLAREGDEELLARCAAVLRLAEQLERPRDQTVHGARVELVDGRAELHLEHSEDVTVARWAAERQRDLFERAFGRELRIAD
jgi:exopolyphosphatase/guanosine-5'-triphosphate,3'-diphosphate pyrophosphatase